MSRISKQWTYVLAVLGGLFFILISIAMISIGDGLQINGRNFLLIHKSHPEILILYLLPLLSALLTFIHFKRKEEERNYFKRIIDNRNDTINRNALFAKEIGEGNYSVDIFPSGETDILGKSLLVMKENLVANHEKESIQNWITEGKNLVSNILRMYNKLEELGDHVLEHLVKYIDAIQGAIYLYNEENETLVNLSTYAYSQEKAYYPGIQCRLWIDRPVCL